MLKEEMAERAYGPKRKEQGQCGRRVDNCERVKVFLSEHPGAKIGEVARGVGISRGTARRWMGRVGED